MGRIVDVSEMFLELGLSDSITEEERAIVTVALMRAEAAVKKFLHYDPLFQSHTEFYPVRSSATGGREVWDRSGNNAVVESISEEGSSDLQLRHLPVRSAPAIEIRKDSAARAGTVAGSFGVDTVQTEGESFYPNYTVVDSSDNSVCMDGIIRSVGTWPNTPGSIRVVYSAGYTRDELHGQDDVLDANTIVEAIVIEARRRVVKAFVRRKSAKLGWMAGVITSEGLGDYNYSVDAGLAVKLFGDTKDLMDESKQLLSEFINMGIILLG